MHANPKENRTRLDHILLEQFLRKGYKCKEILKDEATIFIITHERKTSEVITQLVNESYKELRKAN